ncbi:predicted protein [Sclerotinia sclerotiorum 1980 UF-70]|uniref:Uncharacterized protein n=1 Tax=Sclerotinia sclerotiorum (strain ATCC 18683 / 1980 / Ss-1) TaxID=665079 RepID=A7F4Q3_SCLS1|nr:predicted protein [Sclerotinia sclerotiorum 1980 UF-70]EDN97724.1 predicted protein [Sclerotinia sclerotiorum 1980 UF-70]
MYLCKSRTRTWRPATLPIPCVRQVGVQIVVEIDLYSEDGSHLRSANLYISVVVHCVMALTLQIVNYFINDLAVD